MATTNDLKNGMVLNIDGQLWTVIEFQHVKPGKGGAFVRTKLKNVLSRQGRRQDVQRRRQGRDGQRRQARRCSTSTTTAPTSSSWTPRPTTSSTSPAETVGDAATSCWRTRTVIVAINDGPRSTSSCPASVELDDHLHRARPAGRPLHRRHQAGHARDRRRDPGAAVHHHRREDQGRHPRRLLPRPRQLTWLSVPHVAAAPRPASAPSTSSSRPTSAGVTRARGPGRAARRGDDAAAQRLHRRRWSRASSTHRAAHRRAARRPTAGAGRWTGMPAVDRNMLRLGVYELLYADDVPDAVAIDEAVELASELSTDESPGVRQRRARPDRRRAETVTMNDRPWKDRQSAPGGIRTHNCWSLSAHRLCRFGLQGPCAESTRTA